MYQIRRIDTGFGCNLCVLEYSTLCGHGYQIYRKLAVLLIIIKWLHDCCIFLHPCWIFQQHHLDAPEETRMKKKTLSWWV